MSTAPEPGTARHHLIRAATWLAAAEVVADVPDKTDGQVRRWAALAAMAQAHAAMAAAISADPDLRVVRIAPDPMATRECQFGPNLRHAPHDGCPGALMGNPS